MKFEAALLFSLLGAASAFPGMAGMNKEEMLQRLRQEEIAKRAASSSSKISSSSSKVSSSSTKISSTSSAKVSSSSTKVSSSSTKATSTSSAAAASSSVAGVLGGLLSGTGSLVNTIEGLVGSVAASVNPDDKRPQAGYTFQAPGPTDSRGPCPGLNLLANYGYLPRDGYVNFGQVLTATAEGFNMGTDLATVLAVFAVLADGDITTESWYLGSGPGSIGGLNRHSTVEADVSPNREDFYLGCGDNHHLSSRLFKQNVLLAGASVSKQFDLGVMTLQYDLNAAFSKQYNKYLYYFPFPLIVSLGAFAFYPNFFSNGTYGAGGVANYESISSIIGAQYNPKTDNFEYVPERWPENWYRRSVEYDAVAVLTEALVIYATNPIVPGASTLGTPNFSVQSVLCDILQGFESITPLALAGTEEEVAAAVSWALGKFSGVGLNGTALGCPSTTLSTVSYLYPNANQTGGPLAQPSALVANEGNNVYNKYYFETAPTTPQCSHSYSS